MEAGIPISSMSSIISTTAIGAVVFLSIYVLCNRKRRYNGKLPPGPKPLPLFGNMLGWKQSDLRGPGMFDKWAEEFGDIYSFKFGSYDGVILNSADVIKEVLIKQGVASAGRMTNVFLVKHFVGCYGLLGNDGPSCKENRRAALHSLRDFGMGKKSLDQRIQEEASALAEVVDGYGSQPFDPKQALHNATCNVICSIVFGDRFEYDDRDFNNLSMYLKALYTNGIQNYEMFVPILTPLFFMNWSFLTTVRSIFHLENYIKMKIEDQKKQFNPDDVKSFIDVYLKAEMEGDLNETSMEKNLLRSIYDVFIAGADTTSTSLRWALLYLVNYPQVQAKCQQEIIKELGQGKAPANNDRERLPYVQTMINEVLRIATIAAYGVLHRATEDIKVSGYTIPEDHLIMSNLYHVHMDPEYWGDPKVFRPERWLGEDGKLIKHESFMPFSIGPRECLGKGFAYQEMFIVLVSLLQKFTFKAPDPDNPPLLSGSMTVTYGPHEYKIIAEKY